MLRLGFMRVRRVLRTWWYRLRGRSVVVRPRVEVVTTYRAGLTLAEFRSKEDLVGEMRRLAATEFWKVVMGVLYQERPRGYPVRGEGVSVEQACVELGAIKGHEGVLAILELMAKPVRVAGVELEPDWGVEEKDELEVKHER